jgi:hypothetical protein
MEETRQQEPNSNAVLFDTKQFKLLLCSNNKFQFTVAENVTFTAENHVEPV